MKELSIFDYKGNQVRTIQKDGETWWVLKDVCAILGLSNPSKVAGRLEEDERSNLELGRQGKATIINESGLYSVILRSDKPEAKPFRKWVTSEVLPSIRKTGNYISNPDNAVAQLAAQVGKLTEMVISLCGAKANEDRYIPERAEQIMIEGVEARELCGAKELLTRFDLSHGVVEFNAMLREKGYMEKRKFSRLWNEGEREIDMLTDKGLAYGRNAKYPRTCRGAQPKYYADSFLVLYKVITEE